MIDLLFGQPVDTGPVIMDRFLDAFLRVILEPEPRGDFHEIERQESI